MVLKGKIRKNILPYVFSSFCLSQDYKQFTLVANDYHIAYSYIMLNMSTFSRLWTKQFWVQYPEYKSNVVDHLF